METIHLDDFLDGGILKEKSLLILSKQKPSVRKLIRKEAVKKKAILLEEGKEWKVLKKLKSSFILKFKNDIHEFKNPNLHGQHQIDNAATAVSAALAIKKYKCSLDKIEKGETNLENHSSDYDMLLKLNKHMDDLFKKKLKEINSLGKKNAKK